MNLSANVDRAIGKMLLSNFLRRKLIYGPTKIETMIDQSAAIAQQLTHWSPKGSRVNMLPQLKRVIVISLSKVVRGVGTGGTLSLAENATKYI